MYLTEIECFFELEQIKMHDTFWKKVDSAFCMQNDNIVYRYFIVIYVVGVILRDSHGVAQVRFVTGNKILRIMKAMGLAPDLPEDLYYLIKKAVAIRKHLERNRKDKDSKFRLILVESRIHRLARYYKTKGVLAPNWKYESSTASALVA